MGSFDQGGDGPSDVGAARVRGYVEYDADGLGVVVGVFAEVASSVAKNNGKS